MSRPLRSTPVAEASPLLRAGPPADAATVLNASRFLPLDALPLTALTARDQGERVNVRLPTFHTEAADRARAASTPDTAWPVHGSPARPIPGPFNRPGFDVIYLFRRVINGSLALAFPIPT